MQVYRELSSHGEILPQQPVCILIRFTLPTILRITELDLYVARQREALVVGHFLTLIPGPRLV